MLKKNLNIIKHVIHGNIWVNVLRLFELIKYVNFKVYVYKYIK